MGGNKFYLLENKDPIKRLIEQVNIQFKWVFIKNTSKSIWWLLFHIIWNLLKSKEEK